MANRVKGAVLISRHVFVQEEYGEEAWARVLAALREADRVALHGSILVSSWYAFELNERLDQVIVDQLGGGDPRIFERLGARSAARNLSGSHKPFLSPGDPQKLLSFSDKIYSFYYESGYRTYEKTGPNSGVLTTHEAETFSHTDCLTVIGWYKKALEMCGVENIEMVEECCRAEGGEVCRYRLRW